MLNFDEVKESKEQPFLLSTGREYGYLSNKEPVYFIGNADEIFDLPKEAYSVWDILKNSSSLEEWRSRLEKNKIIDSDQEFKDIIDFFNQRNLLLEIKGLEDPRLNHFSVSRYGIGFGLDEGGNWLVGSYETLKKIVFSEKEYAIWSAATGVSSIYDIVLNIQKSMTCKVERAFELFKEYAKLFIIKGFWSIEYTPRFSPAKRKRPEAIFKEDSIVLPIGQELGFYDLAESNYKISVGKKVLDLDAREYSIWVLVRQLSVGVQEISEILGYPIDFLLKDYIYPMLKKGIICIWTKEMINHDRHIRIVPSGLSLVNDSKEAEVYMASSTLGAQKKVQYGYYFLWVKATPANSLKELLFNYQEEIECTDSEAVDAFFESVPYLIHHHIMNLTILEE